MLPVNCANKINDEYYYVFIVNREVVVTVRAREQGAGKSDGGAESRKKIVS